MLPANWLAPAPRLGAALRFCFVTDLVHELFASSARKLLRQHPLATIVEYTHGYARVDWIAQPMLSTGVRTWFWQRLPVLRRARLTRVPTNHSNMPVLWPADCKWLAREWTWQASVEAGCTHVAIVESPELLSQWPPHLPAEWLALLSICVRYFNSFADAG